MGKVVYYNFLEKGSYIAKLTVRDESGHSVVREMGIDVDDSDCIRSDGDDLCPKFLDYPNKILPFSQSSWDLTTVLESGTPLSGLAPVQTQIESSTRWMKPYQPESNIYYDFSDQVTISGAAINIPQNILENEETRITT